MTDGTSSRFVPGQKTDRQQTGSHIVIRTSQCLDEQTSAYIIRLHYPPTLSSCYCCLTSPFSQEKVWSNICVCFTLGGSTEPPLDPPQQLNTSRESKINWNETSKVGKGRKTTKKLQTPWQRSKFSETGDKYKVDAFIVRSVISPPVFRNKWLHVAVVMYCILNAVCFIYKSETTLSGFVMRSIVELQLLQVLCANVV